MNKKDVQQIEFNEQKFKELILHVADKCEDDQDYGAIKLNKILFYSDFLAYAELGIPITGAEYIALEHGAAPKLLAPIRADMQKNQEIALRQRDRFGKTQVRVIPLRKADLSHFSSAEIALVDNVIDAFCGANAKDLSEYNHLERGWQIAEFKETIPYQAVFLSNEDAMPSDIKRAEELAILNKW